MKYIFAGKTIIIMVIAMIVSEVMYAQTTYDMKITEGPSSVYTPTIAINSINFRNTSDFICGDRILYGGDVYPTVLIGSQCWMAKNLNVGKRIDGTSEQISTDTDIEKYCYEDKESNCDLYGGLYQWAEAMGYAASQDGTPGTTQGICPTGWHIPTYAELQTLKTSVGSNGNALKAQGQGIAPGAGTNTSGFSALFAGSRNNNNLNFYNLGYYTNFWSSTESGGSATTMHLRYNTSDVYFTNDLEGIVYYGYSVRCLKD